jgi:hypothetical protein
VVLSACSIRGAMVASKRGAGNFMLSCFSGT